MRQLIYLFFLLPIFSSCTRNPESSLSVVSFVGIKGRVADAETGGEIINDASIDFLVDGSLLKTVELVDGKAKFDMPVHGILKITSGERIIYRGLFLD